ncbi:MAG: hypothetical protein U0800_00140 [Isosphaeraceae bacterium]
MGSIDRQHRLSAWALLLGIAFPPTLASADILFGPISRRATSASSAAAKVRPGDIAVVTDVVRSGNHAGRFTIHEDDVFNEQQLRAQVNGPKVAVRKGPMPMRRSTC